MNFRFRIIRYLCYSILIELTTRVTCRIDPDDFIFDWNFLYCPYDEERVGYNISDQYHIEYVELGDWLLIPCCLKYNITLFEKFWFKTNRFFTDTPVTLPPQRGYLKERRIVGVQERDAGVYFCQEDSAVININTFFYIIDLEYPGAPVIRGDIDVYKNYTKNYIDKIQSYVSNPKENKDESIRKLYNITGLGLRATIRWDPWTECDYCLGEKVRRGRCHLEPYVIDPKLCVARCEMFKHTLHMDCRAYWTVVKILPRLAELIKDVPNVETVAKCIGECSTDIKPGYDFHRKLRTRILTVGADAVFACPGFSPKKLCYWRRDGIKITPGEYVSDAKVNINEFCQLYFQDVTKKEAGNYTCYLNDEFSQENKVVVEEFQIERIREQWWRHVKYIMYIVLMCFIILAGGLAVAYIQRENFKKLDHEELIKNFQMKKFDFEKM